MSKPSLNIQRKDWQILHSHLLQNDDEQAAFGFAKWDGSFHLEEIKLISAEGFSFQSRYHIELQREELGKAIKRAWDLGLTLAEFHSHPFQTGVYKGKRQSAYFSSSDLSGFEEWVPHVFWRLKRRFPYIAVVIAPDSFDALVWYPEGGIEKPQLLENIVFDDGSLIRPTGNTLNLMREGFYAN